MSVLVKSLSRPKAADLYVKGAPEAIAELCFSHTLPRDYDDVLNYYTKHGYRVIAFATRHFENLPWIKAQRLKRDQAEKELNFQGFLIFENRLKKETTGIIRQLSNANVRIAMCTGDNVRTAISVAKECTMVNAQESVFISIWSQNEIIWEEAEYGTEQLDSNLMRSSKNPYVLAVTGDAFRWLVDNLSQIALYRVIIED